jgi:hypothetical protein
MTAFLITMFIFHVLSVGCYLSEISTKTYPCTKEKTLVGAWFSLLITLIFAVWVGVLLFN